jgi:hypothetical protein
MASIAIIATGTLLKKGDSAVPEVFTNVPEVMRLRGPSISFDLLDVSSHDNGGANFREYIPGFADGDVLSGDLNFKPSNPVHIGIRVDAEARTRRNYKMVLPDTSDNTVTVSTYVQQFEPVEDAGQVLKADFRLKITGAPVWS